VGDHARLQTPRRVAAKPPLRRRGFNFRNFRTNEINDLGMVLPQLPQTSALNEINDLRADFRNFRRTSAAPQRPFCTFKPFCFERLSNTSNVSTSFASQSVIIIDTVSDLTPKVRATL
jgi:hypothetical protein